MSGTQKPAAAEAKGRAPIDKETLSDIQTDQELAQQKAKIEARRKRTFSKVATLLGQEEYIYNWTHPCLFMDARGTQTEVSEFYPKLNVAIDKFYHVDDHERALTDFKREALKAVGIKYAYLTPEIDLADIADDLGIKIKAE